MTDRLVIITPPVAESDMDLDLVHLTEYIWRTHHSGEAYGYGLGGEFGYGVEFDNDVFAMFPFYWGDCTCGFVALHEATEREHSSGCFGTRYQDESERLRQSGVGYDERRVALTTWAKANGYPKAPYGEAVHCTCGTREWWEAWSKEHDHDPACPTVKPNFRHHASDLDIRWYKWIGRDTEPSRAVSPAEWRAIFAECVASVAS